MGVRCTLAQVRSLLAGALLTLAACRTSASHVRRVIPLPQARLTSALAVDGDHALVGWSERSRMQRVRLADGALGREYELPGDGVVQLRLDSDGEYAWVLEADALVRLRLSDGATKRCVLPAPLHDFILDSDEYAIVLGGDALHTIDAETCHARSHPLERLGHYSVWQLHRRSEGSILVTLNADTIIALDEASASPRALPLPNLLLAPGSHLLSDGRFLVPSPHPGLVAIASLADGIQRYLDVAPWPHRVTTGPDEQTAYVLTNEGIAVVPLN